MHASTVLFASLSLLAGLVAADNCCNNGTPDPSNTCVSRNLNSFCCSNINADVGRGCDGNADFPTGRAAGAAGLGSCKSGSSTGIIACA
ncbi:hypothetical protein LX36DRAFT_101491 [Colletotrichum falcatum]|nr:hypothetical protein LX36DRAFT_101491 [Colletotrichum falcatum]